MAARPQGVSAEERFETTSKKELYRAEFHARRKRRTEDWASFAEDVKALAEQVFNDLKSDMREHLVLTHYLQQLENPQVDFSVKQKQPKNIDEAVICYYKYKVVEFVNK